MPPHLKLSNKFRYGGHRRNVGNWPPSSFVGYGQEAMSSFASPVFTPQATRTIRSISVISGGCLGKKNGGFFDAF